MKHRLMLGALASLAAIFMAFGRTQSLSEMAFQPPKMPSVDREAPVSDAGATQATTGVVWPSRAPARLLEVFYVYSNRAPVTRGVLSELARRHRDDA